MVGNKRDFCAGATERTARSFLIVPAVIGMIAVGLVAGGLLRNIPGMVMAARSRRLPAPLYSCSILLLSAHGLRTIVLGCFCLRDDPAVLL